MTKRFAKIYNAQLAKDRCLVVLVGVFVSGGDPRMAAWRRTLRFGSVVDPLRCGLNFFFVTGSGGGAGRAVAPDTIALPMPDDVLEGKTFAFFKWATSQPRWISGNTVAYIAKMDADTAICPRNLLQHAFQAHELNASYWGGAELNSFYCGGRHANVTRCPSDHTYFGGPFYALSFDLARRVAASPFAASLKSPWDVEDVSTGRMVHRVAPSVFEQTEEQYGLYAINRPS